MATNFLRLQTASRALHMISLFRSIKNTILAEYRRRQTIRILDALQDDILKDIGYRRYSGS